MSIWLAGIVLLLLVFGPLVGLIWWLDTHPDKWE